MKLSTESKVGMMVTLSFTVLIAVIALLARVSINRNGYNLRIYYTFLSDLRVAAPVKIGGGIKIGEVKEIKQSAEKTEVILWINNEFKLPRSSTFAIYTTGLIGEKYVNVIIPPLRDNDIFLEDGDMKYGMEPASFDRMMQVFQGFMQDKDGGQVLADIFQNSSMFVQNLNNMTQENRADIRSTVSTAKATMTDLNVQTKIFMSQMNTLTKNLSDISQTNKEDITITLRNLSESTDSLNKILYRLENGRGTLGKLMTDEEIYNNLRDASIYAKDFTYILSKNPSLLMWKEQK
ncbi:MAG TPA: MlaD family protein [Spirochaetota bacterium]|nr:MlaD family protein [Spirochaetota bacterium]HQO24018.1 MlaD family protein [Spirochaetota bacterium]HQQ24116.1 MlaD family protein [Spirochaetota bacterium]